MTESGPLILVKAALVERNVDYLDTLIVPIGLRNQTGTPLVLNNLTITFQADYPVPETEVTSTIACDGKVIGPGALDYLNIRVTPSLLFQKYTNVFRIRASFQRDAESGLTAPEAFLLVDTDYVVVRNAPVLENPQVFVSFCDPEDDKLAELARALLERAGLRPYLAKRDPRTGTNYWSDKIKREIRDSTGTLVIWTPTTVIRPLAVRREMRYSRRNRVSVGLFRQGDTELPQEYAGSTLEYTRFDRDTPWVDFAHAIRAAAERWRRGDGLFK